MPSIQANLVSSDSSTAPTFVLIDGHSLAFRSYFAFAKGRDGGLRTSTGIPTSVTYGFFKALLEVVEAEKPTYLAVAFDLGGPTFRHEADETYKADRPEAPEDFMPDLENLQELLRALNLPIVVSPGYEADDVIGTLSRKASSAGFRVKILSGDRDLFQLIDPHQQVTVLYLSTTYGKGAPPPREFGSQQVQEKLGILPSQVVDFKALCGDKSDNIPGVRGIGEKTAVQLLTTYGSLEDVYAHLSEIKGAVQKKLAEGEQDARHSQYMAQIHQNVPLEVDLEACKLQGFTPETVTPLLEKLEFRSYIDKLNQLQQYFSGQPAPPKATKAPRAIPLSEALPAPEDDDLWFFSAEDTRTAQAQVPPQLSPEIIDTPEKLVALVARLETLTDPDSPTAWDTETTALEPRDADLVGIGCCWGDRLSDVAYIPLGHTAGGNLDKQTVLTALKPILESDRYPKVLQNAKFDRLILRCQGVHLAGVVFDPMLASYLLNPEGSHNLTELSRKFLDLNPQSYDELVPKGKTIADIPIPEVAQYCGMDVHGAFRLVPLLRQLLKEIPLPHSLLAQVHLPGVPDHDPPTFYDLLMKVELPLEPVLAEMEYCGVRVDRAYLKEFSKTLERDLKAIETKAYEAAGETFSLGSPKQLAELLFEKLGLDKRKSRKTKTGYSTDAATLEKLQGDHPVVDAILEHRTLAKLKSTYVDALPALAHNQSQRVHTDFNQTTTATGRLSSSNPNLQNIPTRTAFSRQIRKAFIPQDDWLLVSADYSQIELRILAHLSQEPVLLETYQQGGDIHTVTAKLLFEKEQVSSDERRLAKTINFGVIYGMGAQRFARESGFSTADARKFIDRFNERYSRVFAYLQQMQKEAIAHGYVETILGRRRYFNFGSDVLKKLRGTDPADIDLEKVKLRDQYDAQLLRAAANAPIQGSSADIIKVAMVKLHEQLRDRQARLLLQVHDELVFELPPEEWKDLQGVIKHTMESALQLSVPLAVEIHAGPNWMEAK